MSPAGIAVTGFVTTSLLIYVVTALVVSDISILGFPVAFWEAWEPCPSGTGCSRWHWLRLFIDLVFWGGIAAVIIHRRKRRPPL